MTEMEMLLRKARDLVNQGWCQHCATQRVLVVSTGVVRIEYCAAAAISQALEDMGFSSSSIEDIYVMIMNHLSYMLKTIIHFWNDSPTRTQDEVINKFDEWISMAHNNKYWGL